MVTGTVTATATATATGGWMDFSFAVERWYRWRYVATCKQSWVPFFPFSRLSLAAFCCFLFLSLSFLFSSSLCVGVRDVGKTGNLLIGSMHRSALGNPGEICFGSGYPNKLHAAASSPRRLFGRIAISFSGV